MPEPSQREVVTTQNGHPVSYLISQDGIAVHLEEVEVLLDVTSPREGHQVQETNGVEARVPPLLLLRYKYSPFTLEVEIIHLFYPINQAY